jgi:hypothetical protein
VHLKRVCIYLMQLGDSVVLSCVVGDFLSLSLIDYQEKSVEISSSQCGFVKFSFKFG